MFLISKNAQVRIDPSPYSSDSLVGSVTRLIVRPANRGGRGWPRHRVEWTVKYEPSVA